MALKQISLALRSNEARDGIEGAAKLTNCYAEQIGPDALTKFAIYPIAGWQTWGSATSTTGGARALLALDSVLIGIVGRLVVQWDLSATSRVLGGFATDGPVTMARNRRNVPQVAACCNGEVIIVEGSTYRHFTDTDLPPASSMDCLDGYGIWLLPDGRFFASDLDNFASVDGLSFGVAEANPDGGVRVKVRNREALLYGSKSTEFWTDNGGDPFPFGRVTSVDIGCLAAGSVADIEMTHAFVAHDCTVRIWNGYSPVRISTPDIERLIQDDSDKSNITGLSWTEDGHAFYAITGTNWTKVYDARTKQWHNRESYRYGRWRASAAVTFGGKLLFGNFDDGTIYESKRSYYDEAGQPIVMAMQTAPVHGWPNRLRWNTLHVDMIPGVGRNTTAPQDQSPAVMIDWSDDGGHNWSVQRQVALGVQGASRSRVVTRRLGVAPQAGRTLRLSVSAAVARGIVGVAADVDQLPAT